MPPEVRLAGVSAMEGLADDWKEDRQTCVNALCGYLRLPYRPHPGTQASLDEQYAYRAGREVRHTIIRVITAHLQKDAAVSWQGLDFDFTGAVFDGGDFGGAVFSGGRVSFDRAEFPRGFSGGPVSFARTKFARGSRVSFDGAMFSGGQVAFGGAEFSDGSIVSFHRTEFSGGQVSFERTKFAKGSRVRFGSAMFSGGQVTFRLAEFSEGSRVAFDGAEFSGGQVSFRRTEFSGGQVRFDRVKNWSYTPLSDWDGKPPAGVVLPDSPPKGPSGSLVASEGTWADAAGYRLDGLDDDGAAESDEVATGR
jgi:uncharacterized protein YjbI with pentapeptide repeats